MALKDMFKKNASFFDVDLKTKDETLKWLAWQFLQNGLVSSEEEFLNALKKREEQDSTGIGDGIGIPHALVPAVKESTIGFLRLKNPIDWDSLDGKPVDLIFLIATNGEDGNEHLNALSSLSTILMKSDYQKKFREVKNFKELSSLFKEDKKEEVVSNDNGHFDVVGITACPTGIAHTYMAQEKLLETAKELGLTAKIETQGRRGTEDRLTKEDVDNAKYIILAHDKAITGMDRFNGKKVIDTSTKDAIYHAKELITDYENQKLTEIHAKASKDGEDSGDLSLKKFKDVKGTLLAGVSKMLPFVVAGGIILGLAFLIDFIAGNGNAGGPYGTVNEAAGWFAGLGKVAMSMMVPVLGAYIAYALVGPQGLMPGFVGGLLASSNSFVYGKDGDWANLWGKLLPGNLPSESGFIGAIAAAYLTGLIVIGLTKLMHNFPKGLWGVRDIVFIPVLSLLGVGVGMFALNIPLGYVLKGIEEGLKWLAQHNLLILVGAIMGLMMCVDMGGPINKIAYVIGTMTVAGQIPVMIDGVDQSTVLMAAAMGAGMVPPLGVALSTVLFRKFWSEKDRDAAKANWLMGLCFISEGAIPFMVKDPKRVMVSAMAGGLATGLIVGGLSIGLPAPHGGVFVFPLVKSFLFDNGTNGTAIGFGIGMYVVAIMIGMSIMATILGFWRMKDVKSGKLVLEPAMA